MGYTTEFGGKLILTPQATEEQVAFINKLASTRRMVRDNKKLMELYKGKDGYPFAQDKTNPDEVYGFMGEYFVGDSGQDESVINYNRATGDVPYSDYQFDWDLIEKSKAELKALKRQPGLWLQWVIEANSAGEQFLEWDGGEKFYNYIEWLEYLIHHFFNPWGIMLNGVIVWRGEDFDDIGYIDVKDNVVKSHEGVLPPKK